MWRIILNHSLSLINLVRDVAGLRQDVDVLYERQDRVTAALESVYFRLQRLEDMTAKDMENLELRMENRLLRAGVQPPQAPPADDEPKRLR